MDKKYTYKIKNRNFVIKPIDNELWDKFYSGMFSDFIMEFEHTADTIEESEMEKMDYYIKGVVKGMWAIFNMMERNLVKDET